MLVMRFAKLPTAKTGEFVFVNPTQVALVLPVNGSDDTSHICTLGTLTGAWNASGGEIDSCIVVSLSQAACIAKLEEALSQ